MASQCLKYVFLLYFLFPVNINDKVASQLLPSEIEDPFEYKLTKLLDLHIGKNSNNLQPSLRDNIRSEIRNILEGVKNELINTKAASSDSQLGRSDNALKVGKDNIQQSPKALEELNSQISGLNKSISKILSTFSSTYHDVKNFINKSPVGISFDDTTNSHTEKLFPTNLWNNSSYVPKNCKEIQLLGYNVSGIYKIQPLKTEKAFMVLCDMETQGGGWIHIQKRYDSSQDFYLNWREYKFGFGDLEREFWLGLENIYALTSSEKNELLVEVADRENIKKYAQYKQFEIGSESTGYRLKVLGEFSGEAGDSLTFHVGGKFTTKDFDQDDHSENCAELCSGAWWYKACYSSNLNGKFSNMDLPKKYEFHGMAWKNYRGVSYANSQSRMLIRPAQP